MRHAPKWNPINVCSYHLQEAGATPVQEIAYALATAIGVLDGVRASGKIDDGELPAVVGPHQLLRELRASASSRRPARCGPSPSCGTASAASATASRTPSSAASATACRSTRSALTEQQPENNVQRIVLETLGVTLSKSARARAMQLPAWNEALGLPRPWDQQWSLRMQQVLAFESDLLEYGDIFEGSVVIEAKTAELVEAASAELADVEALGGAFEAIDELKRRLVRSQAERVRRIEIGRAEGGRRQLLHRDRALAAAGRRRDREHPQGRPPRRGGADRGRGALAGRARRRRRARRPRRAAPGGRRRRPRRQHHGGDHRPGPRRRHHRGVGRRAARGVRRVPGARPASAAAWAGAATTWRPSALRTRALAERTGGPPRLLVAKPGLDGHSNGAEQIAVAARDAGFEVIYQGIRLTPAQIVAAARDEDVDIVGLSILSGSHLELVPDVLDRLRAAGSTAAVVVGGIIPPDDAELLLGKGVASVYTPKDYSFDRIMEDLVALAERQRAATPG